MSGERTTGRTTDYTRTRGTAYVEGTASGKVTVAAKDDIVITRDLVANDPTGTDIVGLVAGNNIWVYHPVNRWGNNLLNSANTVNNIDAAILSLRHSFLVQNWAEGNVLGTLNVTGSMAQKYRGPVGTGYVGGPAVSGYIKNYVYDTRLKVMQPPYFLKPESSPWQVTSTTDM
jgi:hypothetical protein